MTKRQFYWAGYVDGVMQVHEVDTGFGGYGVGTSDLVAIFPIKAQAREQYQDVRRKIRPSGGRPLPMPDRPYTPEDP